MAGWAEQEWEAAVGALEGRVRKGGDKGSMEQEAPYWGPCSCCRAEG